MVLNFVKESAYNARVLKSHLRPMNLVRNMSSAGQRVMTISVQNAAKIAQVGTLSACMSPVCSLSQILAGFIVTLRLQPSTGFHNAWHLEKFIAERKEDFGASPEIQTGA